MQNQLASAFAATSGSARGRKKLARRKTIAVITNLIRDWQADGGDCKGDGIQPDADEAWAILVWLRKRSERLKPNTPREPDAQN